MLYFRYEDELVMLCVTSFSLRDEGNEGGEALNFPHVKKNVTHEQRAKRRKSIDITEAMTSLESICCIPSTPRFDAKTSINDDQNEKKNTNLAW